MKHPVQHRTQAPVGRLPLPASLFGTPPTVARDSKMAELPVAARNLMTREHHDGACPTFEASRRLDPGLGTPLTLADGNDFGPQKIVARAPGFAPWVTETTVGELCLHSLCLHSLCPHSLWLTSLELMGAF